MAAASQAVLPTYVRRRRASFVLTSLIDVIFLLVIFFMVTSQIVPFSLIGLGNVAHDSGAAAPPAVTDTASKPVSLRILAGRVMVGGTTVALDALPAALSDLSSRGVTSLILVTTASATLQDMVTTLEMVKASAIPEVTVLNRRSGA